MADGLSPTMSTSTGRVAHRAEMALFGIYEISKVLCAPNDLASVLSGTLMLLQSFLEMNHGLITVLDGTGEPELIVGCGLDPTAARRYFDGLPERAVGQIVVTQMPVVVDNVAADTAFTGWDTAGWGAAGESYSFVGVPIKDRDQSIGTLTISRVTNGLTGDRIRIEVRDATGRFVKAAV